MENKKSKKSAGALWMYLFIIALASPLASAECCVNPDKSLGELFCKGPSAGVGADMCCGVSGSTGCDYWKTTQCIDTPECEAPLTFGCCCIGSAGIPVSKDVCESAGWSFSETANTLDLCQAFCKTTAGAASCASNFWNISLLPVKGEQKIEIKVSGCTPMNEYDIVRCDAGGSANCTTIVDNSQSTGVFIDDMVKWDQNYTYTVVSSGEEKVKGKMGPGNFECSGYKSNEKFCIPSEYFIREQEFSDFDYFINYELADPPSEYKDAVASRLLKLKLDNAPVSCDDYNRMVLAGSPCSNGVCAINKQSNSIMCINETRCQNLTPTNLFGMYFTNRTCEVNVSNNVPKYCFYDKSETTVDYCYDCNAEMGCADYKSKYACMKDNCHLNRCSWNTTDAVMDTGVCITESSGQNCEWCAKPGTDSMGNKNVFNKIFDSCSLTKALALSTNFGYCLYLGTGSSISCSEVVCQNYESQDLCEGPAHTSPIKNGYWQLILASRDPCNIGVCEYDDGWLPACRKNADIDASNPDCSPITAGGMGCEEDYFPPYTDIIPIKYNKGCPVNFSVRIRDKTVFAENAQIISGQGRDKYKTYFCIGSACLSDSIEFPKFTNRSAIRVNGLNFTDDTYKQLSFGNLKEGDIPAVDNSSRLNTVYYYSKDPSGNLEVKKNITIYASENCAYITYNMAVR